MMHNPKVLWIFTGAYQLSKSRPVLSLRRVCFHQRTLPRIQQRMSPISSQHRFFTSKNRDADDDDDDDDKLEPISRTSPIKKKIEKDNLAMEANVRLWLDRVVVGMNLCPFAEKPLKENKVKIELVRGEDEDLIISIILENMHERVDTPGTTLIVCPELFPQDFHSYLEIVNIVEEGLMSDFPELADAVQIAPFHPQFVFEGSELDSMDNWTNRSPYPIFHIIREEEVSKAVDSLQGDASKVWKRNVELLDTMEKEMGSSSLQQYMQGEQVADEMLDKVHSTLRKFRTLLGSKNKN